MSKGFTLLETALSLTIFSMILYLASTSLINFIPKFRLERAVWEICSAMNAARYKALFEGASFRVRLYPDSYVVEKYDEDEKTWNLREKHLLEGVILEANNAPLFTAVGSVSGLATIYVSNAWGRYKITMAITGRIKAVKM